MIHYFDIQETKMKSRIASLFLLVVLIVTSAFAPLSPAYADGITVTDALGRAVTLPKVPSRIVLAGKALFMVADAIYVFPEAGKNITALGSTVQGAGDFIPMIDPTFKDKTMLDSNAGPEQIAAVKPDCAILKSSTKATLGDPLEQLGIPVIYVDFETPEQYDRDMKTLGQVFQNPDRASKVLAYFSGKADAVKKVISPLKDDQKPKTLILYYSVKEGAVSFNVPPMEWMQTTLVELAGGTPVWKDANPGKGWTKVSLEQVAAWNPDYVFVVAYATPATEAVKTLLEDPQWKELKAVKDGKIYPFATDVYSWDQPDTRWILGLQWVAAKLHPDLFKDWDITKAAQDFYKEIYAMDDASFTKNIAPLLAEEVK
jgi:iron complex transport system substrate-binding protein